MICIDTKYQSASIEEIKTFFTITDTDNDKLTTILYLPEENNYEGESIMTFFEFLLKNNVGIKTKDDSLIIIIITIPTLLEWVNKYSSYFTASDFPLFVSNICNDMYWCKECESSCYKVCISHGDLPKLSHEVDWCKKKIVNTKKEIQKKKYIIDLLCALISWIYYTSDKQITVNVLLSLAISEAERLCPELIEYEFFHHTDSLLLGHTSNKECIQETIILDIIKYSELLENDLIKKISETIYDLNDYIDLMYPNSKNILETPLSTPEFLTFISGGYEQIVELSREEKIDFVNNICSDLIEKTQTNLQLYNKYCTNTHILSCLRQNNKSFNICIICEQVYYQRCSECNPDHITCIEQFIIDTRRIHGNKHGNIYYDYNLENSIKEKFRDTFGVNITSHILNKITKYMIDDTMLMEEANFFDSYIYSSVDNIKDALDGKNTNVDIISVQNICEPFYYLSTPSLLEFIFSYEKIVEWSDCDKVEILDRICHELIKERKINSLSFMSPSYDITTDSRHSESITRFIKDSKNNYVNKNNNKYDHYIETRIKEDFVSKFGINITKDILVEIIGDRLSIERHNFFERYEYSYSVNDIP